jgi:hypothetical protein
MPLRPLIPGTTEIKAFADFSPAETEHWVQQAIDEQMASAQRGWPIDFAALDFSKKLAKGNQGLLDRIDVARRHIQAGPQPKSEGLLSRATGR